MEHEIQNHWKTYYCPNNCGRTFPSATECKSHLQKAHASGIPEGQLEAMIALSARPLKPEDGITCPLCREVLTSLKSYQRHVGQHQEQLALFALPSLDSGDAEVSADEDDESEEANNSGSEVNPKGATEDVLVDDEGNILDPTEPRYCVCSRPSFGNMICCDNGDVSVLLFSIAAELCMLTVCAVEVQIRELVPLELHGPRGNPVPGF